MAQPLFHRGFAPGFIYHFYLPFLLHRFGKSQELLRGILCAVEQNIFYTLQQIGWNIIVPQAPHAADDRRAP